MNLLVVGVGLVIAIMVVVALFFMNKKAGPNKADHQTDSASTAESEGDAGDGASGGGEGGSDGGGE